MDSICSEATAAHIAPGPCLYGSTTSPWLCMKKKYVTMSMLVQGPKQPGIDINLYLTLLKEELATLWEEGARTWEASRQDYFDKKAAVITTVQDYPGYGYFSGQVVQGFYGCVRCKDNTM